ncbi:hypothetical protein EZS27_032375 [termite gut metagenome]|uniref:Uncharacterized protein n=1 Tax=termite gut metagenome TaxID=433724 RepID=A0A5J4Q8B5_9ZZZZ
MEAQIKYSYDPFLEMMQAAVLENIDGSDPFFLSWDRGNRDPDIYTGYMRLKTARQIPTVFFCAGNRQYKGLYYKLPYFALYRRRLTGNKIRLKVV